MDQCRVFSRDGVWIGQLRSSAERAWALVTETAARVTLSIYDLKCNPFLLNFGNLLLIENSDGLPPWVGVIDDIGFDGGKCFVWAYTPERFFSYRRGPRTQILTGNAGEIFRQLIDYVNRVEITVLTVDDINSNTSRMEETLHPTTIDVNLKRIIKRSGEGYRWRPEVRQGKLIIYADWFPSLVLTTGLILQDGYNLESSHPMNLAAPVNDILTYGEGADWETRMIENVQDAESVQEYGLRQKSESVDTPSADTLKVAGQTLLDLAKQPKASFPISALNKDDTFRKLAPGALATFTKLVGQGWTNNNGTGYLSYDRVVKSMVYDPRDGMVGLAV